MVRIESHETRIAARAARAYGSPAVVCAAKASAMFKSLQTIVFSVPLAALRLELEVAR